MYWGILPLFYPNNLVSRLVGSDFTLYNASDPAQQRHSILAVTAFARAKSCGNGHASLLYWRDSQCRYTQPQVQNSFMGQSSALPFLLSSLATAAILWKNTRNAQTPRSPIHT